MSLLAHTTYGAPRFEREKRAMNLAMQHEIREAKRIQDDTDCSWTEALRLAHRQRIAEDRHVMQQAEYYLAD